jgi:hypothetical protein
MNMNRDMHPIETGLRELAQLEQAGVFNRTTLDATAVTRQSALRAHVTHREPPILLRFGWRWMPVAAALVLAMGVWGWMFSRELSGLKTQRQVGTTDTMASAALPAEFPFNCLTGPGQSLHESCRRLDLDADERITMADFRQFQLTLAIPSQ